MQGRDARNGAAEAVAGQSRAWGARARGATAADESGVDEAGRGDGGEGEEKEGGGKLNGWCISACKQWQSDGREVEGGNNKIIWAHDLEFRGWPFGQFHFYLTCL